MNSIFTRAEHGEADAQARGSLRQLSELVVGLEILGKNWAVFHEAVNATGCRLGVSRRAALGPVVWERAHAGLLTTTDLRAPSDLTPAATVASLAPMTTSLAEATQAWLSYLEGQDNQAALGCFCTRIIPCILDTLRARFRAEYPAHPSEGRYDGLVTLLGYTPDTSILATRFTAAERVAILHTPETAPFVDDVRSFCGLPADAVIAVPFDRRSLSSMQRALCEGVASLGSPRSVAVEVTGGTKPMSTTLHVAAALADMDTVYIDYTRYDPRHRKPMPDSIHMRLMESPLRDGCGRGVAGATLGDITRSVGTVARALEKLAEGIQSGDISLDDVQGPLGAITKEARAAEQALGELSSGYRKIWGGAPGHRTHL